MIVPREKKKKEKATPAPSVNVNTDTRVQEQLARTQLDATIAMTEIASRAIENPQMGEIIRLLSEPAIKVSKRIHINRDDNGLIESIDIEEK